MGGGRPYRLHTESARGFLDDYVAFAVAGRLTLVWLSVDAGTSLVKTVAFDDDGAEVVLSRRDVSIERPQPGFSEQDPEAVWDAVADTVREVGEAVGEPVRLLAVTGQGDGCWVVDDDGEPQSSAILWNDARGRPIIEQWRRSGLLHETFRVDGSVPYGGPVRHPAVAAGAPLRPAGASGDRHLRQPHAATHWGRSGGAPTRTRDVE